MKVFINNQLFNIHEKKTILEICNSKGILIPFFCYNSNLKIAGNCRICIVEISKLNKPLISCANFIYDNIKIFTNSFNLNKYRENILEFLLINHPLDCPICDQGGECDLQEQYKYYGFDRSRFFFKKKSVNEIFLNKFIKTILNRCILCLRCIRFFNIYEKKNLGVIGRSKNSKISFYFLKTKLKKNISGNIIDLCPVGALTLKKNSFKIRPWEENSFFFYNFNDFFGFYINYIFKNYKLIKVLPIKDTIFFSEFINDKSRFIKNYNNILYFMKNFNKKIEKKKDYKFFKIYISKKIFLIKNNLFNNFNKKKIQVKKNFNNIYIENINYNFIYYRIYNFFFYFINFKFKLSFLNILFFELKIFQKIFKFFFFLKKNYIKNFFFNLDIKNIIIKNLILLKNSIFNTYLSNKSIKLKKNYIFNNLNIYFFQKNFFEIFIYFLIKYFNIKNFFINSCNKLKLNFKTINNFNFFNLNLKENQLENIILDFYNILGENLINNLKNFLMFKNLNIKNYFK